MGYDQAVQLAEGKEAVYVPIPISWVPNEILYIILSQLDAKTLMIAVPQVCTFWRSMCQELDGVHLDFRWWGGKIPREVFSGLREPLTAMGAGDSAEGDGTAVYEGVQQEGRSIGGMLELFPHTTSVTMGYKQQQKVEDAHLLELANKCRGLTHVNVGSRSKRFIGCNLTDTAVLALADSCRVLTHVNFNSCGNLTDAAVLALAAKCRRLTHANFSCCWKLTDAAVVAVADTCHGLTHADFSSCNLTDTAVLALADSCRVLTHVNFHSCGNLTDAAVLALADQCRELTYADFGCCWNLTNAALLALADMCRRLTHCDFENIWKLTDAAKATVREQRPNCSYNFFQAY